MDVWDWFYGKLQSLWLEISETMKGSTIKFIDIAMSMNVHAFIIWEFIRKFGHEEGVKKDKYGRGYVSSVKCRQWINQLAEYVTSHNYSYKQEFNKRQYLFRDENKLAEEKKNERDVRREYSTDRKGNIIRYTYMKDALQVWRWNPNISGWTFIRTVTNKRVE